MSQELPQPSVDQELLSIADADAMQQDCHNELASVTPSHESTTPIYIYTTQHSTHTPKYLLATPPPSTLGGLKIFSAGELHDVNLVDSSLPLHWKNHTANS